MANRLGPARNRRYLSFYGFPSSVEAVLPALRRLLTFVVETAPDEDQLDGWFSTFDSTLKRKTIFHYRHMIMRVGLYKRSGTIFELTAEGRAWLETQNHGLLLSLLNKRFDFVGDILNSLSESPKTVHQLSVVADQLGFRWKGQTQVSNRLFWLHALGTVTKQDDRWVLGGAYYQGLTEDDGPAQVEAIVAHVHLLTGVGTVVPSGRRRRVEPVPQRPVTSGRRRRTEMTTLEIEQSAVEFVLQDLLSEGLSVGRIYQSQPGSGLDLICWDNDTPRWIEVKGTTNQRPDSVILTAPELEAMRAYGDQMWLYVVSGIGGRPTLTKYRNPGALNAVQIITYRLQLPSPS